MEFMNLKAAAEKIGARHAFEAGALLAQAGYRVIRVNGREFVRADDVAEYLAEIA